MKDIQGYCGDTDNRALVSEGMFSRAEWEKLSEGGKGTF